MPRKLAFLLVAAILAAFPNLATAQGKDAKDDALAKEAVEKFFAGFKGKDIDAVLKVCDAPFCREGGKDLATRDELKTHLQKSIERRDPAGDSMKILRITTLPKLEKADGKFTDGERATVMGVMGKQHRVVEVEWNRAGEGKHRQLLFLRLKDGKAHVVGVI